MESKGRENHLPASRLLVGIFVFIFLVSSSGAVFAQSPAEPPEPPSPEEGLLNQAQIDALQPGLAGAAQEGVQAFIVSTQDGASPILDLKLLGSSFDGVQLQFNFNAELNKLTLEQREALLQILDDKVTEAFGQSDILLPPRLEYTFLVDGQSLIPTQPALDMNLGGTVQGKKIVISPGHGRFDYGYGSWPLQRSHFWGIVEDYVNLELAAQLVPKLTMTGADVYPTRELNKLAGDHYSGNPWWQMDASEYVRELGAPSYVWNPDGLLGVYKDAASRPEYANWIDADALVTIHNNGNGASYCNAHGTETWYDTANGYQGQSLALAQKVQRKLVERIRAQYDPNWCDRGVKGSPGWYPENYRFHGPAVLTELGFMDVYSDNKALQDEKFRNIATTAFRDAIVEFFGGTGNSCPTIKEWKAQYWNNETLKGSPILCRNDSQLNFNWKTKGPVDWIKGDHFSARWTRTLDFLDGKYRFHVQSDDGARVYLDGKLILDQWKVQTYTSVYVDQQVTAGPHEVKVEYFEGTGSARMYFWREQLTENNLAYKRPVTATSRASSLLAPVRINDGLLDTRWESRSSSRLGAQWVWIDLGMKTFDRVTIKWDQAYASKHFVGWSDDKKTIQGFWYAVDQPATYLYNLGEHSARYIGVLLQNRAPGFNKYSIWELETYYWPDKAADDPLVIPLQPASEEIQIKVRK
jgi:N-acetylmuramoyl-L-alanine amidase